MFIWWLGVILYLVVVVPVVLLVLNGVIQPALQIKKYADDIYDYGSRFGRHLDQAQGLATSRDLVRRVNGELERYGRALEELA
jgi:hypothetical protein